VIYKLNLNIYISTNQLAEEIKSHAMAVQRFWLYGWNKQVCSVSAKVAYAMVRNK